MEPKGKPQDTRAARAQRAAELARRGESKKGHRPTGQRGQDERDESALRISRYHNPSQSRS